jgi:hypothetical protein
MEFGMKVLGWQKNKPRSRIGGLIADSGRLSTNWTADVGSAAAIKLVPPRPEKTSFSFF